VNIGPSHRLIHVPEPVGAAAKHERKIRLPRLRNDGTE
jgi:hypothetical protein